MYVCYFNIQCKHFVIVMLFYLLMSTHIHTCIKVDTIFWRYYFWFKLKCILLHGVLATCTSVFLISSYGAPLAQRAFYLALHSSLFGPDGTVMYDYIITNSINSLLTGSICIPNGTHTNLCWAHASWCTCSLSTSIQL